MAYRKFKGDQLFTGNSWAAPDSVLITDASGRVLDLLPAGEAGDDVLRVEGIVCPGFINAHCHLELSHMAGVIPEHSGMVPFLMQVMSLRQKATEATMLAAMQAADELMWQSGIVAVGDICNTSHSLPVKQASALRYHNFIEVSGFVNSLAHDRYEQAGILKELFLRTGAAGIVPHAPYSVSPALFQLIEQQNAATIVSMHNQESIAEDDFFRTGVSPLQDLYRQFGIDISFFKAPGTSSLMAVYKHLQKFSKLILVHNVTTTAADLKFIQEHPAAAEKKYYWCLCPSANQYINEVLPPVDLLMDNNARIVLGTDSLASNKQLSITEEMKLLAANFPHLKMETILQWATINGAEALGMEQELGSFDKGKQPGIVQLTNWHSTRLL